MLGAAAALVILAGLMAPPAQAAGEPTASHQHIAQMEAAHAGGAAQGDVHAQQTTARACFADPQGDVIDEDTDAAAASPQADIVEHCIGYEDALHLRVRVAAPTNPTTDPAWEEATFVGWFVDVDADGDGEYFVDYSLDLGGALTAEVVDIRTGAETHACSTAATFDGTSYDAGPIPAACIGEPAAVSATVAVFYNAGGEGSPVHRDTAPNGGMFTPPVDRDEGVCTDPLPAPFADRDTIAPVHRLNVDCLFARGITLGVIGADGLRHFQPRPSVTRGQFSAFTFRTLANSGVALPGPRQPRFADVPAGRVFDEEIHRLAAAGILRGYAGTNRFGPQDRIRRDQTASVLLRAVEHATGQPQAPERPGAYFADTVGNFHAGNIDAAFEEGLVQGIRAPSPTQLGLYGPAGQTTRQQMASVLVRFLRNLEEDA